MESIIQTAIGEEAKSGEGKEVSGVKEYSDADNELLKIVEGIRTSIKVVGAGGAGGNTISRLVDMGIDSGDVIAVNTDAMDLLHNKAWTKVLIGMKMTGGIGAGNNPELGEECAKDDIDKISSILTGADMVFITCGLGGGTGTGSAPVIAEVAKDIKALTVAVVTIPFAVEGRVRAANALVGLKGLRKYADTVIVIPNDRLLDVAPNLPLNAAFKVADELLANSVKGITELVTKAGLINLDFADVRAVLQDGGTAMIGFGQSPSDATVENRAKASVDRALSSPLLDTDISDASGALINVVGGPDMTLSEAQEIVKVVSENINPNAQIIWGAQVDNNLDKNVIRTLIVVSGVRAPTFEEELKERAMDRDDSGSALSDMGLKHV